MPAEIDHPAVAALKRFHVSGAIGDAFPGTLFAIAMALGLGSAPSSAACTIAFPSLSALLRACSITDERFDQQKSPTGMVSISGLKHMPHKYLFSVESLVCRVLRSESLFRASIISLASIAHCAASPCANPARISTCFVVGEN